MFNQLAIEAKTEVAEKEAQAGCKGALIERKMHTWTRRGEYEFPTEVTVGLQSREWCVWLQSWLNLLNSVILPYPTNGVSL